MVSGTQEEPDSLRRKSLTFGRQSLNLHTPRPRHISNSTHANLSIFVARVPQDAIINLTGNQCLKITTSRTPALCQGDGRGRDGEATMERVPNRRWTG